MGNKIKKGIIGAGTILGLFLSKPLVSYASEPLNRTYLSGDSVELPEYVTKDSAHVKAYCVCPCCGKTALLYVSNRGCVEIVCLTCDTHYEYYIGNYKARMDAKNLRNVRRHLHNLNESFTVTSEVVEASRAMCEQLEEKLENKMIIRSAPKENIQKFITENKSRIAEEDAAFDMRARIRESELRGGD